MRRITSFVVVTALLASAGCDKGAESTGVQDPNTRDRPSLVLNCEEDPASCNNEPPPNGPPGTNTPCSNTVGTIGSIPNSGSQNTSETFSLVIGGNNNLAVCSGAAVYRVLSAGVPLNELEVRWFIRECFDGPYGDLCYPGNGDEYGYVGGGNELWLSNPNPGVGMRRIVYAIASSTVSFKTAHSNRFLSRALIGDGGAGSWCGGAAGNQGWFNSQKTIWIPSLGRFGYEVSRYNKDSCTGAKIFVDKDTSTTPAVLWPRVSGDPTLPSM